MTYNMTEELASSLEPPADVLFAFVNQLALPLPLLFFPFLSLKLLQSLTLRLPQRRQLWTCA